MAAPKKSKKAESGTAGAASTAAPPAAPPVFAPPKPGSDEAYMHRIKNARAALLMRAPFYGYLALKLNPELDDRVKTAATDGTNIKWARPFLDKLSDPELVFVTAHEVMHCALEHIWRTGGRDPRVWNVACFPTGTLLPTGIPIEQVATMSKPFEGDLVTVQHQGGEVRATPEHPFWVRKRRRWGEKGSYPIRVTDPQWVDANDITVGDYVCVPRLDRYGQRDDTQIDLSPFVAVGCDRQGRKYGNRAVKSIPLNVDTAWLIGLYVADGDGGSWGCRVHLGGHQRDIAERVVRINAALGYQGGTIRLRTDADCLTTAFGGPVLARWLRANVGANSHAKHVPAVILYHRNPEIRRAFLEGLLDGDGNRRVRHERPLETLGTVSDSLAQDVVLLLAQDGIGVGRSIVVSPARAVGDRWINSPSRLHSVLWSFQPAATTHRVMNGHVVSGNNVRWRADEHGVWYPVKAVTREPYTGLVHNLVDTPDHTYVAAGLLVHNCDRVINDILNESGGGMKMPPAGLTGANGKSAEEVYLSELAKASSRKSGGKGDGEPGDGMPEPLDNHDDWYTQQARNDPNSIEGRTLRDGWKAAVAQAKSYGNVPSAVSQIIDALLSAKVDWRQVLVQRFTQTAADYSWKPVDRRLLGAGILIPSLTSSETRVVVAIDTSGSVPDALIAQFWAETASILHNYGVKARIMTCDTEIGDEWQEWQFEPGKAEISRRGGTSFKAPFERLEKYKAEGWEPSLIVYLTDLEGDFPDPPFGVDVVWAIPPSSKNHKAPFGEKLVID